MATHRLGVPAVVDSLVVADSAVVVIVVVADTEDDNIIRSSFYSI